MKTAVVTGATGQDGAYLSRFLVDKGYNVVGTMRRTSSVNDWRLKTVGLLEAPNFQLVEHDITDLSSCIRLLVDSEPDEFYNLAAQSFVGVSFKQPLATAEITGQGALNSLEAIRIVNPKIKFYQASTSEMFGKVQDTPQHEDTPFYPRSPYGTAKLFAHWSTVNYRESYNLFAASGILFNHESPLRGPEFVTRKISQAVASIKLGLSESLSLGNLSAKRDWGYAPEYVDGMYRMLQVETPDTFVLATGETETVRHFVELAFSEAGINIEFKGNGIEEKGFCSETGRCLVQIDPKFFRPAEVDLLIGDASKAAKILNWQATTGLESLVAKMVAADLLNF